MKVRITPFTPEGVITAPPSKSVAMRYILLAAVADGRITEREIDAHVLRILRYKQAQGWIE